MKRIIHLLVLSTILFIAKTNFAQPNAWINEIHYDNSGSDVDEAVEIVIENSSSYTLSDFNIVLYNGSGGASYQTHSISGFTVGSTVGDYTIYYKYISSIQNGAPDGISLDYQSTTIQFLSYEGSFTATNGNASGLTAEDIGVSESGSALSTESLQLTGTGSQYSEFSWASPSTKTVGSVNDGQSFSGVIVPTINLSTTSISGFNYDFGSGPSSSQSFTVGGSNLTNNITVAPATNYEISNDNTNFQSIAITLSQTGGTVATTSIYIRLKSGLAVGNYNNQDITISSVGVSSNKTLTCSGSVTGVQYANIPYTENFNSCSAHKWNIQSITSNKDWSCGSGTISINGYGADVASNDYLISPSFNLDNYSHEYLSFVSYTKYADAIYPPVELLYSTNYIGDANIATWTPITATWSSENSEISTHSGNIDISSITGTSVCFAFQYTSSGTGSGTSASWSIDDFSITQNAAGSAIMPNAWINEIHYDNTGSDVGEMIEIVIDRADTLSLADFNISLYNGGDGTVYNTRSLSTYLAGEAVGDFYIYYSDYSGIQNGAPDGIAIDWKGTLVQFISYEGSFIGSGGPADGIVSTDIGVIENGSEAIGQSLQLVGTGLKYSDFTWVDPTASPGSLNFNQSFGTPAPPPSVPLDWKYILVLFIFIAGFTTYKKLR